MKLPKPITNRLKEFFLAASAETSSEYPAEQTIPLRPTRFTSRFYAGIARRIWEITLISVPFDLVLTLFPPLPRVVVEDALTTARWAALISTLTLLTFREQILDALTAIGTHRARLLQSKVIPIFFIALGAVGVLGELLVKLRVLNPLVLAFAILVTLGAIRPILKSTREQRNRQARLIRDRTFWVEQTNKVVFLLSVFPIIGARVLGLIGALEAAAINDLATLALWEVLTVICLLEALPKLSDFTFNCTRCGTVTSIALRKIALCPSCAEQTGLESFALPDR